jgi:hypothetical protein
MAAKGDREHDREARVTPARIRHRALRIRPDVAESRRVYQYVVQRIRELSEDELTGSSRYASPVRESLADSTAGDTLHYEENSRLIIDWLSSRSS